MCCDLQKTTAAVCVSSPNHKLVASASLHFEAESEVLLWFFLVALGFV